MKTVKWVACAMLAMTTIASAAACTRAQARTPEQVVALNTPPPPARVTIPVQLQDPEPEPAPAPPATAAAPPPVTRPRADPTAKPAPPPVATASETPIRPVLQTTTDIGALEVRTNQLLKEAQGSLDRINYGEIGVQARAQYDAAKSFIRTAVRALQDKNYTYAEYLAVKAAAIAKELAKS